MRIIRDITGKITGEIFNDPAVKATVVDDDRIIDLRTFAADPRCYALIGQPSWGAFVIWPVIEGVYDVHIGVLTQGRGPWAVDFVASMIEFMFCTTDCVELVARVPQGALGTLALARRFKFVERWKCPSIRFMGEDVPYTVMSLTLFEWMPAEDTLRNQVFVEMERGGMGRKAASWYQRWALLSAEKAH
jgi:hypothetical protein